MDSDIKQKMQEAKEWLKKEYSGIRTGQSNPSLLDGIRVESYGSKVSLNQVGSISVEDARTLRISPWDSTQNSAIEKAIREADLGISVVTDSTGIRVIFPELTSERREQLMKLAKSKLEDARITVRSIRDEVMKQIEKMEKSGELSKDEKFTQKESVQMLVTKTNNELDELFSQKERELKN
jgi:ribosome recycling factor